MQNFSRVREALDHNKAEFPKTNLDTPLIFAEIASAAGNDTDNTTCRPVAACIILSTD